MNICSPRDTVGTIRLPFAARKCELDGKRQVVGSDHVELKVKDGKCSNVIVSLSKAL
jgi:hypothetical protein